MGDKPKVGDIVDYFKTVMRTGYKWAREMRTGVVVAIKSNGEYVIRELGAPLRRRASSLRVVGAIMETT